jgi:hypothetical protein
MGIITQLSGKASAMPQNQTSLLSQVTLHFEYNKKINDERAGLSAQQQSAYKR